MFDTIAPRYDLVNRVMTFGMDVGWRRRTIRELALPPGSRILDLACGTGDFSRHLERGGHRPVGIDLSFGMLAAARTDAPLVHGDLLNLPVRDAAADGAVCGFALRNLVELPAFLSELARTVRPGGRIALLEVSTPDNPVMRWGHGVYFGRVVPALGGLLSEPSAYQYLPRSMAYLPPSDELLDLIGTAGFGDVRRVQLTGGIAQLFLGTRTGPGGAQPSGSDRGASSPQL
jgi:demethylmenaquinone methyltransferase / 2-methoxy-6-polyprenyl-1,4-benzoquinol methylase